MQLRIGLCVSTHIERPFFFFFLLVEVPLCIGGGAVCDLRLPSHIAWLRCCSFAMYFSVWVNVNVNVCSVTEWNAKVRAREKQQTWPIDGTRKACKNAIQQTTFVHTISGRTRKTESTTKISTHFYKTHVKNAATVTRGKHYFLASRYCRFIQPIQCVCVCVVCVSDRENREWLLVLWKGSDCLRKEPLWYHTNARMLEKWCAMHTCKYM